MTSPNLHTRTLGRNGPEVSALGYGVMALSCTRFSLLAYFLALFFFMRVLVLLSSRLVFLHLCCFKLVVLDRLMMDG